MMKLDFTKQYDVAVFGAGIGGIAAALAAARRGHEVCLVEKQTQIIEEHILGIMKIKR